MSNPNEIFIIYALIILLGYFLKRISVIKEEDGRCLINIVYYATLPAVIFKVFNGQTITSELSIIFFISIIYGIIMTLLAFFFFRKREITKQKGLIISSVLGFNIPLFSYPFVQAIWGDTALLYLAVFDLGSSPFFIFSTAYVISAYYSPDKNSRISFKAIGKKLLFFPPLQCYLIALFLCIIRVKIPGFILDALSPLTRANTALVLIIIGLFLNFTGIKQYLNDVFRILSLRYIAGFIAGILIIAFLPCSELIKTMLVLALLNPVGLAMIAYAIYFKYDARLAGILINVSNVISFILMWIIAFASFNLLH